VVPAPAVHLEATKELPFWNNEPLKFTFPLTSNLYFGFVVPIPTEPIPLTTNAEVPIPT
jgi:hypothetical protein